MTFIQKVTSIFIISVTVLVIAFDVYVYTRGGTDATVSWAIFSVSYRHPMIPFSVGVLCGHLFWQMKPKQKINEG